MYSMSLRRPIRRALLVTGVVLLVPACTWLAAGMLGLLPTDVMAVRGYSGLRVLGSIAVSSCLLAAIGSADF
jgi:hypothetical protein